MKVLPESYQKSNEFSASRKCGQKVAADDRRTFTDKDRVRRIQTLRNDNKDAMLDLGLVMLLSLFLKDYIRYVFAQSEYVIRCCVFSLFHLFCRFYAYIIFPCCAGMFSPVCCFIDLKS